MAEAGANGGDSQGAGHYFTRTGPQKRRFSSRSLRLPDLTDGNGDGRLRHRLNPPPVATSRRLYRDRLPTVYHQNGDFGLRFVGALEGALDPVLALLDSLPAHFDPDLAPQDLLELLAGWLGVELDESWPDERRRELVRRAGERSRLRGTRAGLELALSVAFPDVPLRIEEQGGVTFGAEPSEPVAADAPGFVVYCDEPLEGDVLANVARVIEQVKPVHVRYRLRVKARRTERS